MVVEILVVFIAQVHDQVLVHCEVGRVDSAGLSHVLHVLILIGCGRVHSTRVYGPGAGRYACRSWH